MIRKISLSDKFNFYDYLSVMLDGGVSISETLQGATQKMKNTYFREKITMLSTYVSSGDSLSKSMKKAPQVFSKGEISIIESGETTGKLSSCLMQLSENMRKSYELRQKIKGALTYPLIIFIFLFLAIVIVLTYVIPTVSQLFEGAGVELPLATKMLLNTSRFVTGAWLYISFFVVVVAGFMSYYLNSERGKANFDYFLLSLPLLGPVMRNYMLSSIATNLGSLVGSGVPIVQSFSLVAPSLNNSVYESYLLEIKKRVSQGEKIVESMLEVDPSHRFFPQDFTQLLSVGEKTASIDKISIKLADQFTREVDYSLNNLTKWIEPIAILIAGIFVMWFAFAIFGAILKVTQVVG